MNVQVNQRPLPAPANTSRLATADCDIHPQRSSDKALHPYLEQRWIEHMQTFGARPRQAYQRGPAYPKGQPNASRRDAYPPEGGRQGSSLSFMQKQLLDQNNCVLGILNPTGDNGQSYQNREFGAAICHAMNEWVLHEWLEPEPRLKGSIVVPFEDADAAVAELEKYAGNPHFAQVLMLSRTSEPPGQKRYWKLYEAAAAAGLPVGVHAFGFGGYPVSGSGWPSYYIEDMVGHAQSSQAFLTSMVIEGVFERLPDFQLVLVEAGFAWLPSLSWRLDKIWNRLRVETPHLKRPPSEYIHESVWLTTQPMEEPAKREQVLDAIDWIGWDRLLFATDYPHWDYDDPDMVLPMPLAEQKRRDFFLNNAAKLYKQVDMTSDATALLAAARGLAPLVETLRDRFDLDRTLPPVLVDAMHAAGLFRMWVPQDLGGAELDPLSFLTVIEELSRQDGSVGWCAVIPAGYARLSGALAEDVAHEIFQGTGRGLLVGTLNPTGKAVAAPGGYQVTGRWNYGSFIAYGEWVLGNCIAQDASGPRRADDGSPEFRLCLFPREAATVFDIWHVGGLRATGSNDFEVTDLFVPESYTIALREFQPPPLRPGPLYAVPMTSTFVSCIATVALGIARAAIEALIEIAGSKTTTGSTVVLRDKPLAQADMTRAEALLCSGRAFLFDELGSMWANTVAGRSTSIEDRARVRMAAVHAAQCAIQATDLMYQLGGGAALFQGGRLERCFRDVHAAGQHVAVSPLSNLEPIGRVLFGLPPGMARF